MATCKLFLCRDGDGYELSTGKPKWDSYYELWESAGNYFCKKEFERLTGIKLRDGYGVRVTITTSATGFAFRMVGKPEKLTKE